LRSKYWNDEEKQKKLRPYPECECVACCVKTCDYSRRILAREIARRIFIRYFKADTKSFEPIKEVFSKISVLIKYELNDEPFSQELVACVRVQLLRRIKYGTRIALSDTAIRESLEKMKFDN
jgi:hypothetical protein